MGAVNPREDKRLLALMNNAMNWKMLVLAVAMVALLFVISSIEFRSDHAQYEKWGRLEVD